jgi:anti-anti-sigma factor
MESQMTEALGASSAGDHEEDGRAAAVLTLTGELDLASSQVLRTTLEDQVNGTAGPLVVDLMQVTFMDSTALAVFVRIRKVLRDEDREIRVVCQEGPVIRLLSITGLVDAFGVHATVEDALAAGSENSS